MKFFIFLSLIFSGFVASANENDICRDMRENHGDFKYTRQFFAPEACFLSVKKDFVPDMVYRSLIFRETGALMIFNSFGNGPESTYTGARVFYFFPRQQVPAFHATGQAVEVSTSHKNLTFFFDLESGKILSASNARIKEAADIVPENDGGIEILSFQGLLLDSGFKMGSDPTADLARSSTFRDENNQTCTVKNSDIFSKNSSGDISFRLSDLSLKKFLSSRCPQIKYNL